MARVPNVRVGHVGDEFGRIVTGTSPIPIGIEQQDIPAPDVLLPKVVVRMIVGPKPFELLVTIRAKAHAPIDGVTPVGKLDLIIADR